MQYVNFVYGLITVSQTIVGRGLRAPSSNTHPTASEICYLREDGARRPLSYFLDTLTDLYTWRSYYKKRNYSRTVVSVPRPPAPIQQQEI